MTPIYIYNITKSDGSQFGIGIILLVFPDSEFAKSSLFMVSFYRVYLYKYKDKNVKFRRSLYAKQY